MTTRSSIIVYHAVGECHEEDDPHQLFISTDTFKRQMEFLKRRRNVVRLDEIVHSLVSNQRPSVAITFDDGYRNVLTNAAPILNDFGVPSTLFVPTKWIGLRNTWVEPSACPLNIMSAEELRECERSGISIESHGDAHINYQEASPEEVRKDVRESIDRLTQIIGRPPRYLAYPYGLSSAASRGVVNEEGFEAAFSIDLPHDGLFAYERTWIRPTHGMRMFALKTSGRWKASRRGSALGSLLAVLTRPFLSRRSRG